MLKEMLARWQCEMQKQKTRKDVAQTKGYRALLLFGIEGSTLLS